MFCQSLLYDVILGRQIKRHQLIGQPDAQVLIIRAQEHG